MGTPLFLWKSLLSYETFLHVSHVILLISYRPVTTPMWRRHIKKVVVRFVSGSRLIQEFRSCLLTKLMDAKSTETQKHSTSVH